MTSLTKHKFELTDPLGRLTEPDKEQEIKDEMGHARRFLNLLAQRLEKDLEDMVKESENLLDYDKANWQYMQAENLGYRKALRKAISYLGIQQTEKE